MPAHKFSMSIRNQLEINYIHQMLSCSADLKNSYRCQDNCQLIKTNIDLDLLAMKPSNNLCQMHKTLNRVLEGVQKNFI